MKTYTQINYLNSNTGYFPELTKYLLHGFSWGKESKNMEFKDNIAQTKLEIKRFLTNLTIKDEIYNTFVINAQHSDDIVYIDNSSMKEYKPNPLGRKVKCDALFTNSKEIILTIKPADCTTAIVYAESSKLGAITGIVHTGRRGVSKELTIKAIKYLVEELKCNLESIKLCILPHIAKENNTFTHIQEFDMNIWKDYIELENNIYYICESELAIKQYQQAGVQDENITIYNIDTYTAAENQEGFSYKYNYEMRKMGKEGREGNYYVAIQLK